VLEACMNRLSPAHREILDLFYYCENSIAEVSMAIGIPQATVKSRMFYARKHLARLLMDAGFNAAVESDESESAELGAR
jgi:RNA polymerase sigma-70 factor (ECF subfamily)